MRNFFETSFGSVELLNIQTALDDWCQRNGIEAGHPDRELVAAVMINLFREGHTTVADLSAAASRHKGLRDLSHSVVSACRGLSFSGDKGNEMQSA